MPKVERATPIRPQPQAGRPPAPAKVGRATTGPRALAGALSVPIAQVHPDPNQPRKDFADDALGELADSIRDNGVLQPLIVRDSGELDASGNDVFIIIAGERRWRAAQRAGLTEIPVVVRALEEADPTTRVLQLIENLQREDLNIVERSEALKALKVNLGSPSNPSATWDDVAARVGVSKRRVLQLANVADLAEPVQEALRTGTMTEKHTRAMKGLSPERQEELTTVTVAEHLAPDDTSAAARVMKQDATVDAVHAVARTREPYLADNAAAVLRQEHRTIDGRARERALVLGVLQATVWSRLEALLEYGMMQNMEVKTLMRVCREALRDEGEAARLSSDAPRRPVVPRKAKDVAKVLTDLFTPEQCARIRDDLPRSPSRRPDERESESPS